MAQSRTDLIRNQNDAFRHILVIGGQCVLTQGIIANGSDFTARALDQVRSFADFDADNDPYGEHDFGSFLIGEIRCIWKIDYYDHSLNFGSDDPADETQTKRVLTIMLCDEY